MEVRTEYRDRVEWKERTVERRVEVAVAQEATVRTLWRTRIIRPDGTQEEREHISETRESSAVSELAATSERTAEGQREASQVSLATVEPYRPRWQVAVVGGLSAPSPAWRAGAHVQHRVAGPLWLGVLVLAGPGGGAAGLSVGAHW